ncbi:MAG: hypothetical protein Q9222_001040 [Ikaeria aurantiellina]
MGDSTESPTPKHTAEICCSCFAPAPTKCRQCGAAWYCSVECQRKDWTFHKYVCAQFRDFIHQPDPTLIRAILFPEDEENPRFVWLKQKEKPLDLDFVDEKVEAGELLGFSQEQPIGQQQVPQSTRRSLRKGPNNDQVYLLSRERSLEDGSKPNMSIGTITKGRFAFSWRGPVVAIMTGWFSFTAETTSAHIDDMSVIDFRDLVDYFESYGQWLYGYADFGPTSFWWLAPVLREELGFRRQIQGVKVRCDVEARIVGQKYQTIDVAEGHPALAFLQPFPATLLLGLPLVMRRMPSDEEWREESEANDHANTEPGLIAVCVDPKSRFWGMIASNSIKGPMLMMRQDMQDLHHHHLEAMIQYLKTVISPAMVESMNGNRDKREVLEMFHPSRLDWFFKMYRMEMLSRDKSWQDTPPLFTLEKPGGGSEASS